MSNYTTILSSLTQLDFYAKLDIVKISRASRNTHNNYKRKNMIGTIKKKTDKGFGFITSPELGKDLFFHSNSLVDVTFDEIQEGDQVSFDSEESPKGLNAINVKRA